MQRGKENIQNPKNSRLRGKQIKIYFYSFFSAISVLSVAKKRKGGEMNSAAKKGIEKLAVAHGLGDFKWMDPRTVVIGDWVRMKCNYGCPGYGKRKTCPPYVPVRGRMHSVLQRIQAGPFLPFRQEVQRPGNAPPLVEGSKPENARPGKEGFSLGLSRRPSYFPRPPAGCARTARDSEECRQPYQSRPTLEAFGVDVYSTARMLGYPIQVVKDYHEEMNRYGLLLVE